MDRIKPNSRIAALSRLAARAAVNRRDNSEDLGEREKNGRFRKDSGKKRKPVRKQITKISVDLSQTQNRKGLKIDVQV